ncbi:MAG: hypothetical protein WD490_07040 [Opitutales bacterium]
MVRILLSWVMGAERPEGPYQDLLGKPLIAPGHDPTLRIDDDTDKTPWMLYGEKSMGGYHLLRLHSDMISLADQSSPAPN